METTPTPGTSRRSFVSAATGTVAAVAALAAMAPRRASAISPALQYKDVPGTGDIKVLNYALSLEQLEANLYQQAVLRLTTGGTNDIGVRIPGLGLATTEPDVDYITEFTRVEQQHRDFLENALGSQAIPRFKYDFGMQNLSRAQVSRIVYVAERTGVAAYLGAIPKLSAVSSPYLPIAAAILGTEARHTSVIASIRNKLFGTEFPTAPAYTDHSGTDQPMTPLEVYAAVSGFIVT